MKMSRREQVTYVDHAAEIIAKAASLQKQGQRFALITSIAIRGGAARDVGSLALVDKRGEMFGYLSNGCIDRDIRLRAIAAMASGAKQIVQYGEGSRFMDLKLPCGGSLEVLVDPYPDDEQIKVAAEALKNREQAVLSFSAPDDASHGVENYRFVYSPVFRLGIAGRGAIFRATAQAADAVGLQLHLMSPDTDDLNALSLLRPAAMHHLQSPQSSISLGALDRFSALLTLFHDHDWEPQILQAALETPAFFIGCLGSKRTHAQRINALLALNVSADGVDRLKGPIGLVPSLRSAPLIAISALAEVTENMPPQIWTA